MTDVDLSAEKYDHHREAGAILAQVREEARERVAVGTGYLELSEWIEDRIRELGGDPAFPVNISVDEEAAHGAARRDDHRELGEELVKLDVGVHIDGWIADAALTVDLRGEPELVEAAREALSAAVDLVEPGVETGEIGAAIESTIEDHGYRPVVNLTGHGLGRYEQHTQPTIPNRAVDSGVELQVGDVVAVEPFATSGSGKVGEGTLEEIFMLDNERSVRNRDARQALKQISEEFKTLPFAKRWLDVDRPDVAIRRLKMRDVIEGYPVLKEGEGALVAQAEDTLIVTEDGCEVTTRPD
ncbi:MAG: type II methionyl aminopeptidase [Halobacteriales archaeon]